MGWNFPQRAEAIAKDALLPTWTLVVQNEVTQLLDAGPQISVRFGKGYAHRVVGGGAKSSACHRRHALFLQKCFRKLG